ncbi:MAG: hypothetical protein B7Z40_08045 [Bosea sp. 12-68-7]|nr:MAG: hypothetical protein B7Z40_08045 [Bosea sp. 12-68-7]
MARLRHQGGDAAATDGFRRGGADHHVVGSLRDPARRAPLRRDDGVPTRPLLTGADYVQALRRRQELCAAVAEAMIGIDVLLTAGSPFPAQPIDKVPKWLMYQKPSITMPFNVTGLPALALCAGYELGTGLPVAIQLVGHPFAETTVFQLGHAYEQATQWRATRPALLAA